MTERTVLITGANGGIGQALCEAFTSDGWRVFATDISERATMPVDGYFSLDLERFANDEAFRGDFLATFADLIPERLECLVNNAAYQVTAPIDQMTAYEWRKSLDINVTSPFLLVRTLLGRLEAAYGNVINITSVHTKLSKPGFCAYASSKAALETLTRVLAVEIGSRVRVNAISPAAIRTSMLEEGFRGKTDERCALESCHPTNRIGSPAEIASIAVFIAQSGQRFLNGAVIGVDGGIAARLHDPV